MAMIVTILFVVAVLIEMILRSNFVYSIPLF